MAFPGLMYVGCVEEFQLGGKQCWWQSRRAGTAAFSIHWKARTACGEPDVHNRVSC